MSTNRVAEEREERERLEVGLGLTDRCTKQKNEHTWTNLDYLRAHFSTDSHPNAPTDSFANMHRQ